MSQAPSDITIDSPTPEVAHQDFEKYFQWLMPAFERNREPYDPALFGEELLDGTVLLVRVWKDKKFAALAALRGQETLDGRELLIMGLVGESAGDWLMALADTFDKVAAEAQCGSIVLEGRPGWQKRLRGIGYKLHQVTMRKQVRAGNGQLRIQ